LFKRIEHPQPPDSFPGCLSQEAAAGALADQCVNLFGEPFRDNDMFVK